MPRKKIQNAMSRITSGSSFSRLARQVAAHVEPMKASTIMLPYPNSLIPPKIGIVNKTCRIREPTSISQPGRSTIQKRQPLARLGDGRVIEPFHDAILP